MVRIKNILIAALQFSDGARALARFNVVGGASLVLPARYPIVR
jgi:hypothetical protein